MGARWLASPAQAAIGIAPEDEQGKLGDVVGVGCGQHQTFGSPSSLRIGLALACADSVREV